MGGPYTQIWHDQRGIEHPQRIDEQRLAAERTMIDSLVADLREAGPEGAALAGRVLCDARKDHADYRAAFETPTKEL